MGLPVYPPDRFEKSMARGGYRADVVARIYAQRRYEAREVQQRAKRGLVASVPGIARRYAGLSLLQAGVLYVIGFHVSEDGVFRHPVNKLVHFLGTGSQSQCAHIPHLLTKFELVERLEGSPPGWRLTRLGHAVYRELAGEDDGDEDRQHDGRGQ